MDGTAALQTPSSSTMPANATTPAPTAGQAAKQPHDGHEHTSNDSVDGSARQSPSAPNSPQRVPRTRPSKDLSTQSPTASQPTSRKPSPHKDTSASASASAAGDPNGPSPYGTRSRNRTASRPNYAEDHDDQMDFEYTNGKKTQDKAAAAAKPQDAEMQKTPSAQGRRGPGAKAAAAKSVEPPANGNDGQKIPGTSTFAVKEEPGPTTGKKRKAPSTSAQTTAPAPPPAKRRASAMANNARTPRESAMVTFTDTGARLQPDGGLLGDDGIVYRANDYVYLVCEPPGEPYYIARIMEFFHVNNKPTAPVDALRINWIYRPRDIGRKATDTRVLFASMHSDSAPLTSLRGKTTVKHRTEIEDFDRYRKQKDTFYYSQMYDRYMRRYYEVIPTNTIINVPDRVKKALDERWQFVIVEIGRAKELTSAIKSCKRCAGYCANSDSVDCAVCKLTYHMQCVQPPLLKKPSRGFGWSCGPCSRKQERRLEARGAKGEDDEEEALEEEDHAHSSAQRSSSPESVDTKQQERPKPTKEQLAQADLWPYRYLGIHCKVEDAVDYDDRVYPRSSSRLGPRHQANVNVWHGRPVEYVKPAEKRRKWGKGAAAKPKPVEDTDEPKEKRPKWVLDAPPGYLRRGEDFPNDDLACTAKSLWKPPPRGDIPERGMEDSPFEGLKGLDNRQKERLIDEHMAKARKTAPSLGLKQHHTNFLDRSLHLLYAHKFDSEAALKELRATDPRKDLKEPKLTKEELRRFEEGVSKFGSNMTEVIRHVGNGKPKQFGEIVRFYYTWKKTERGKQIWGSYEGRKSKKQIAAANAALADDVADDHDDSAFDYEKATKKKRGFECKHCGTRHSRQWRRAPGVPPGATVAIEKGAKDKPTQLMVALCNRCAILYRKYGMHWEDIEEIARRVAQTGGRAIKRKQDEEVLIELINANEDAQMLMSPVVAQAAQLMGMEVSPSLIASPEEIAKRKKLDKAIPVPEKEPVPAPAAAAPVAAPEAAKKKIVEKPPEPPLIPEKPRLKEQPCGVCLYTETFGDEFYSCSHCRLTVHSRCYGIPEGKPKDGWKCDPCMNDMTQQYSTCYECVLCPIRGDPSFELYETPKPNHKKKTEREREKDRLEKILVQEAIQKHNKNQEDNGWPIIPREPLKPTANNNWVHVACAIFTGQIKFRTPELLEVVEGTNAIPTQMFEQECKICRKQMGACVTCYKCPNTFHVTCAQMRSFIIGFDVTPVKGSRKDVVTTVQMGEEHGTAEAMVCCRDHGLKSIVHLMIEPQADGKTNALQTFVRNFKQADLSLTGTVRKAAAITSNIRTTSPTTTRNGSIANGGGTTTRHSRVSPDMHRSLKDESNGEGHINSILEALEKECAVCKVDASPRWHKRDKLQADGVNGSMMNGHRPESEVVCHRCWIGKLKQPPKLSTGDTLPPLPKDGYPPVSTPAQIPQAPTWQAQAQHPPSYAHPQFDPRSSVPIPAQYAPQPPPYANGVHHASTPPHPPLPRIGSHASPPAPGYAPSPGPLQAPGSIPPGPQSHGMQQGPLPVFINGFGTRDSSAPPPQQMQQMRMHPPGPSQLQNTPNPYSARANGPPPMLPGSQPPPHGSHLPTLNQGPPLERRYSQTQPPPPSSHSSHPSPSFGHQRPQYTPGPAGSPPMHVPSPAARSVPSSRGRDANGDGGYQDQTASMRPPRNFDPALYDKPTPPPHPPRSENGASAKADLKNLLH